MSKYVILARSPSGKVTTIDSRVGEKGVPFGWEWTLCETKKLPPAKELASSWDKLVKGKVIKTSTSLTIPFQEVETLAKAARNHEHAIEQHRFALLKSLDVDWIRAQESNDSARITAIRKFKRDLRSFKLENINDEELINYWPPEFTYTLDDYMPLKQPLTLLLMGTLAVLAIVLSPLLFIFL